MVSAMKDFLRCNLFACQQLVTIPEVLKVSHRCYASSSQMKLLRRGGASHGVRCMSLGDT